MNLHGIVAGVTGAVNPLISAQALASQGYTKSADYSQVPAYADPVTLTVQVQPLQTPELQHLDSLNIQGERKAVYLPGTWNAVARVDGEGGDLLKFPDRPGGPARTWLVVLVLESWPDWTKVAVTLQVD